MTRVYLAGPEVFLAPPDLERVRTAKVDACAARGWTGCFPSSGPEAPLEGAGADEALVLFDLLRMELDSCDAAIANLTPFRGPSADVGTVWEVGYLIGRGVPVVAYTNAVGQYAERAAGFDSHAIESFGLTDNLMVDRGVWRSSGVEIVRTAVAAGQELTDLTGFLACCEALALLLPVGPARP